MGNISHGQLHCCTLRIISHAQPFLRYCPLRIISHGQPFYCPFVNTSHVGCYCPVGNIFHGQQRCCPFVNIPDRGWKFSTSGIWRPGSLIRCHGSPPSFCGGLGCTVICKYTPRYDTHTQLGISEMTQCLENSFLKGTLLETKQSIPCTMQ